MRCASCGSDTPRQTCGRCGRDARLNGRYALVRPIGRGRTSVVFEAMDFQTREWVAVKIVPLAPQREEQAWTMIRREAVALSSLRLDGVPRLLESFDANVAGADSLVIVQELVRGPSLESALNVQHFAPIDVLAIMERLLEIVQALHAASPRVLHRDIRPANVVRRLSDGALYLVDFGSCRMGKGPEPGGASTQEGGLRSAPFLVAGFCAPEQLMGVCDERSDLYGLGVLAVRLLSRKAPRLMLDPARQGRLAWRDHVEVLQPVDELLTWLLAPRPEHRPQSATQALEAVRDAREHLQRGLPWRPDKQPKAAPAEQDLQMGPTLVPISGYLPPPRSPAVTGRRVQAGRPTVAQAEELDDPYVVEPAWRRRS